MECDSTKGCPVMQEMHKDMYKDGGVRDRAIKSVCKVDMEKEKVKLAKAIVGKPLFFWILGPLIGYCIIFSVWATQNIIGADAKYVNHDTIENTLKSIDKRLGSIEKSVVVIETEIEESEIYREDTKKRDTLQDVKIHNNAIRIEKLTP